MKNEVKLYNFSGELDWKMVNLISEIDRFDASWSIIKRREGANLGQLRTMATIQSVGASTRIEGSKMSDLDVKRFLKELDISKLEDRDKQEVAGYYSVLETIIDNYDSIQFIKRDIQGLHKMLLQYSSKDTWHRGNYKTHSNAVEAQLPDGSRYIIFRTTPPGHQTEDSMNAIIDWYNTDNDIHPLVNTAIFVYEFLTIHPFQDGNGRMSRLLTTLSLLQKGYDWVQYASFEHEIESSKKKYYQVLRSCQAQRPDEDITEWINYFLRSLLNVKKKIQAKIEQTNINLKMSPREKTVYTFIANNAGCKSSEIARSLGITGPTIKRILTSLHERSVINKHDQGPATNYTIKV
ncbi:MAG: Fic family protein [Bacteroidota bacterium]